MSQLGSSYPCKYCKTGTLRRLHRSWLIKTLFGWLPYRPYECKKCGRRSWVKPTA